MFSACSPWFLKRSTGLYSCFLNSWTQFNMLALSHSCFSITLILSLLRMLHTSCEEDIRCWRPNLLPSPSWIQSNTLLDSYTSCNFEAIFNWNDVGTGRCASCFWWFQCKLQLPLLYPYSVLLSFELNKCYIFLMFPVFSADAFHHYDC